jgi:hypothetical protein
MGHRKPVVSGGPFFEFTPTDLGWAFVFDAPGEIHQMEAPELEERGPDLVFDSTGRLADLAVQNYFVAISGWSEQPRLDLFDKYLRAAAERYIREEDVTRLGTFELRDRLEAALRLQQQERTPLRMLARLLHSLWRSASGRTP